MPPDETAVIYRHQYTYYPWREKWRQASFRGVLFYVEMNAKTSGRRTAMHVFPKRDTPYAEDLGRRGYEFHVVGYVIGPNYVVDRENLQAALEDSRNEGPGILVLPTYPDHIVTCVHFQSMERREQGGFCEFHMVFAEAGDPKSAVAKVATSPTIVKKSNDANEAVSQYFWYGFTVMQKGEQLPWQIPIAVPPPEPQPEPQ